MRDIWTSLPIVESLYSTQIATIQNTLSGPLTLKSNNANFVKKKKKRSTQDSQKQISDSLTMLSGILNLDFGMFTNLTQNLSRISQWSNTKLKPHPLRNNLNCPKTSYHRMEGLFHSNRQLKGFLKQIKKWTSIRQQGNLIWTRQSNPNRKTILRSV